MHSLRIIRRFSIVLVDVSAVTFAYLILATLARLMANDRVVVSPEGSGGYKIIEAEYLEETFDDWLPKHAAGDLETPFIELYRDRVKLYVESYGAPVSVPLRDAGAEPEMIDVYFRDLEEYRKSVGLQEIELSVIVFHHQHYYAFRDQIQKRREKIFWSEQSVPLLPDALALSPQSNVPASSGWPQHTAQWELIRQQIERGLKEAEERKQQDGRFTPRPVDYPELIDDLHRDPDPSEKPRQVPYARLVLLSVGMLMVFLGELTPYPRVASS